MLCPLSFAGEPVFCRPESALPSWRIAKQSAISRSEIAARIRKDASAASRVRMPSQSTISANRHAEWEMKNVHAPRLEIDGSEPAGRAAGWGARAGAGAPGSGQCADAGHRCDAAQSAGIGLAYVAPHLRRLRLQPARSDQQGQRQKPAAGLDVVADP